MKKPLVSVLIPVYNVEKYLSRCLDSIISQTLSRIEIICVNDGSEDNSAEILKEYRKKDSRIKIVNKKNGGLPSARNAGIEVACGEYIAFVDSDDYIEKNMLKKLYKYAESKNSEVVICGAEIFPKKPRAEKWLYDTLSPSFAHYKRFKPEILFERKDASPFLWRVFVKKDLIDRHNLRLDEKIIIGEDKAFQTKLYINAKGITIVPDKLYHYMWRREDSIMHSRIYNNFGDRVVEHVDLVEAMARDIAYYSNNIDKSKQKELILSFLNWSIQFIYDDFMKTDIEKKCQIAEKIIPVWKSIGYLSNKVRIPEWKKAMYDYISLFLDSDAKKPVLSLIINMDEKSEYVKECIKNVSQIENEKTEIIIINNRTSEFNYLEIQKLLYNDKRVRLYNTPKKYSDAKVINTALGLVAGQYFVFMEANDCIKDEKTVYDWVKFCDNNDFDICSCSSILSDAPGMASSVADKDLGINENSFIDNDIHSFMYRKEFVENAEIDIKNYSILTGFYFINALMCKSPKIGNFSESVFLKRNIMQNDWENTKNCERAIIALNKIADMSLEANNAYVHANVFLTLNSDVMQHVLPSVLQPYNLSDKVKKVFVATILDIINKADNNLLQIAGFDNDFSLVKTLYRIIANGQKYLVEIEKG